MFELIVLLAMYRGQVMYNAHEMPIHSSGKWPTLDECQSAAQTTREIYIKAYGPQIGTLSQFICQDTRVNHKIRQRIIRV